MMLVSAGAEVIVREDCADGAIFSVVINKRIGPPSLDQRLRAYECSVRPCAERGIGHGRKNLSPANRSLISIVGSNAATHFFRRERAALVVPAVARAVRRRNVEFDEVYV